MLNNPTAAEWIVIAGIAICLFCAFGAFWAGANQAQEKARYEKVAQAAFALKEIAVRLDLDCPELRQSTKNAINSSNYQTQGLSNKWVREFNLACNQILNRNLVKIINETD